MIRTMNPTTNHLQRALAPILIVCAIASCFVISGSAQAGQYYRQRYSAWNYHPQRSYHYTRYTFHPVVSRPTVTYQYHYAIHYPTRPRYVYYYNPIRKVYWGRYDIQEAGYSMLKPEDRKEKLDDILESAFPEPGDMPPIPESTDGEKMAKPDLSTIPKLVQAEDAP